LKPRTAASQQQPQCHEQRAKHHNIGDTWLCFRNRQSAVQRQLQTAALLSTLTCRCPASSCVASPSRQRARASVLAAATRQQPLAAAPAITHGAEQSSGD
jgi:hypothetical protein